MVICDLLTLPPSLPLSYSSFTDTVPLLLTGRSLHGAEWSVVVILFVMNPCSHVWLLIWLVGFVFIALAFQCAVFLSSRLWVLKVLIRSEWFGLL